MRRGIFDTEEIEGIRGLTSLTEPSSRERVGAIVDVAVIGARGDGKTQFIVHAIRSLRAYAPPLAGAELQYNRDVLQVVMNAREPRPEATAPGVVPHYVFRIGPAALLGHIGFFGRLGLLGRASGLYRYLALALVNAVALTAGLAWWRQLVDPVAVAAGGAALVIGGALGWVLARRRFLAGGEIEIVFWDVAGEHVYSASAADYYSFLNALVRERKRRASHRRAYAFAPVLLCNPLALGTHPDGSSYARLRKLMPLFASLNAPAPRAMVAINRWALVERVCEPDTDRGELLALVPRNRTDLEAADHPGGAPADEVAVTAGADPLPLVRRDVLRRHCLDAEDDREADVDVAYLRYDAGIECELREVPWSGFDGLDERVRRRWRAPTSLEPDRVVEYLYEEGPGSFEGSTRGQFLSWLARLAYEPRTAVGHEAEVDPDADLAPAEPAAAAVEPGEPELATTRLPRPELSPRVPQELTPVPFLPPPEAVRASHTTEVASPPPVPAHEAATEVVELVVPKSAPVPAPAPADEHAPWRRREDTSPGIGPTSAPATASVPLGGLRPLASTDDRLGDDDDYLPSPPGGFRSGGT